MVEITGRSRLAGAPRAVRIRYRNRRGQVADRNILPERFYFGSTEFHDGQQWFMEAIDLDRPGEYRRTFAMKDIQEWYG